MPSDGQVVLVSASFYYTYVRGRIDRFQAVALSALLAKAQPRGYDAPIQAT